MLRRVALALALTPLIAVAQVRPPSASPPPGPRATAAAEPGSDLTVYLMTMGVGKEIWEQFGHNAIWFHLERPASAGGPADAVYNWGIFDFSQPNFIPRFLQGRMLYSMGGYSLESTMEQYRLIDRSVWVQELDLTNSQKVALRDFVLWNAQPQNASYYYDYYRDNCSTRVRDALDRPLGGLLRATFDGRRTGHTYRWHTMRLTQGDLLLAPGMDVGLGRPADREMSAYDEMFLPMKLREYIRELRVTGPDGTSRPLVKSERTLYESTRYREHGAPPRWTLPFLAIGVIIAGLIAALGWGASRGGRGARRGAAIVFTVWSLVAGILGLLLLLLWTVTHHTFAHRNENLLLFNPVWLVLAVLAPLTVMRGRASVPTRWLAVCFAVLALAAPLMHAVGLSRQANAEIIAFGLPPVLALAWALWRISAPSRVSSSRPTARA
jgi:hypothetical protein